MNSELNRVIGRAFADEDFRQELFANPNGALADFDLTAQERENLVVSLSNSQTNAGLSKIEKTLNGTMFSW